MNYFKKAIAAICLIISIFSISIPVCAQTPKELFELADAKYKLKEYEAALSYFKKAAEQGDVEGQALLGSMYYNGEGVLKDLTQAVFWFKKSAEQGNAKAQYLLGLMYYYGEGVIEDLTQTVFWYTKAAEQGDADAQ